MEYLEFTPTALDIERYPHLKNGSCYRTGDGIYEMVLNKIDKYTHLRIHRVDDAPVHDFMDLYEIKNRILGEDVIAVEAYPKKSDFKNGSHTYHLWTWDNIETPNLSNFPKYL
jgi:hypothetical protein